MQDIQQGGWTKPSRAKKQVSTKSSEMSCSDRTFAKSLGGTIVGLFFGLVYVLSHRLARLSEASTSDCACVEKMVMRGERRDVAAARRLVDCGRCSRCHGLLEDPFCSLNEFDAQRQDGLEADLR